MELAPCSFLATLRFFLLINLIFSQDSVVNNLQTSNFIFSARTDVS